MSNAFGALLKRHLSDAYGARRRIARALPGLARRASAPALRQAIEEQQATVVGHAGRIEQAFAALGAQPRGLAGDGVEGLLARAGALADRIEDPRLRDLEICADLGALERHEAGRHGAMALWAQALGADKAASLLGDTRDECNAAARRFERLAATLDRAPQASPRRAA